MKKKIIIKEGSEKGPNKLK